MSRRKPLPYQTAIPQDSLDGMYASWGEIVSRGESGSVYYHNKSDLCYRLKPLLTDAKLRERFFRGRPIEMIDVESSHLLEEEKEWKELLVKASPDTIFCLLGMEKHLISGEAWLFHLLMQQCILRSDISIVCFYSIDPTHPQFAGLFAKASTFSQRVVVIPLHSMQDTRWYLHHQALRWESQLDEATVDRLANLTKGGYFLLPKQALRTYLDNPKVSDEEILFTSEMRLRVIAIWRQLLPSEQAVMKAIVFGGNWTGEEARHSADFLQQARWIEKRNDSYELTIPLLASYIVREEQTKLVMEVRDKAIWINGVLVQDMFSEREREVLICLIDHQDKLVERDRLIEQLDSRGEGLSNWSMDQIISRLRKRLVALGLSARLIKTVHGKGYRLELGEKK